MVDWFPTTHIDFWFVMSQRDGFSSGFFLGTLLGGVVGGVVGALLAARQLGEASESQDASLKSSPLEPKPDKRKRLLKSPGNHTDMELARRSLEDKIAQLNEAIDDVRQQLGGVNGKPSKEPLEASRAKDPRQPGNQTFQVSSDKLN
jgi:gas vesicle protein